MIKNILVTGELLQTDESKLTPEEAEAVAIYKERREIRDTQMNNHNKQIVKDCKLLCSGMEQQPIPEYGWMWPVEKLCYKLEALNYQFAKYGLKVILEQTKEKFAELRFYTHIIHYVPKAGIFTKFLEKMLKYLGSLDYGIVFVTDVKEFKSVEWEELTEEQFNTQTDRFGNPLANTIMTVKVVNTKDDIKDFTELEHTTFLVHEGDKYYKSYLLTHLPVRHAEFTKKKLIHSIYCGLLRIDEWLISKYGDTPEHNTMATAFDYIVDDLVNETVEECSNLCQHCGMHFGRGYKKYETEGWYTYLCEDCAAASGRVYREYADGATERFKNGKPFIDTAKGSSKENDICC